MPHHLKPSTDYAADALLPGDPGRALALAQQLLTEPRMSNHARGLWGYTGQTPAGRPLSIQSTGMGGPSAAIVLEELAELRVRRAIRVGTCAALDPGLAHGDLIVAGEALAEDGTSRALGSAGKAEPDAELTARLAAGLPERPAPARIVSTDLFYDDGGQGAGPRRARSDGWRRQGAVAVEMEAATLFTLGGRLGVATGCVLAVSDVFEDGERRRMGDEGLAAAAERMGALAAAALDSQA
ncbi:MAG: purine-nucleoside phosphorylase [Solirubrobacterales bacterium]